MPRVAALSGSLYRRSLPARFSTGWSEDPGEAGKLREVDALYHRLLLPPLPRPLLAIAMVTTSLPASLHLPRKRVLIGSPSLRWPAIGCWRVRRSPGPCLPGLLRSPGRRLGSRCRDRAAAVVNGPCRLPRAGTETAGGEEARPAGPAGLAGSARPAGVGAPASSTDSCSSPDGRTCQVSWGGCRREGGGRRALLLERTAEDRDAERREGGVEVRRWTGARPKKSLCCVDSSVMRVVFSTRRRGHCLFDIPKCSACPVPNLFPFRSLML